MTNDGNSQAAICGYEWSMDCGGCGELIDLSGMHIGSSAEEGSRIRKLVSGDEVTCSKCGTSHEIGIGVDDE